MGLVNKPFEAETKRIGRPITKGILGVGEKIPFIGPEVIRPSRPVLQTIGENVLVPSNIIGPGEMFRIVRGMRTVHDI